MVAESNCSSSSLAVTEVQLDLLEAFKVVGDEASIEEYISLHPPRVQGEWSALYLQFDEAHALGTVSYRWDQGYKLARLLRASLRTVQVVLVDAPWMPDGRIPGDEKAAVLKEALGLPQEELLTRSLGQKQKILACRETDEQWELVVPLNLFSHLERTEVLALELRPNQYGCTSHCRSADYEDWRRFDDLDALRDVAPPDWIRGAFATSTAATGSGSNLQGSCAPDR